MTEKQLIDKRIGENIKLERNRAGYTQDEFSEMIGIGAKSFSAVERGIVCISMVTLVKIIKTLNVSANTILFGRNQENDVSDITEQMNTLSEKETVIVRDVIRKVIEAFSVNE